RVLPGPLHEVGLHATGVAFDRARSAADARNQALGGQNLQVTVDRDRRDGVLARQLADRGAAVAADVREDLYASQLWWWLVGHLRRIAQTRSMYARFLISSFSGRKASIACTRCRANRFNASSPFLAVARNGLPITP